MALTVEDVLEITLHASDAGMGVREYAPYGESYIALVGGVYDFQSVLNDLREYAPKLLDKLGKWSSDGVGMTEVWYWRVPLIAEARDRLFEIEENNNGG